MVDASVVRKAVELNPKLLALCKEISAQTGLSLDNLINLALYEMAKREGIHAVGELIARSEADLLDIRNFGQKSIDEVKAKLAELGLALKDSAPGFDPTAAVIAYDDDEDVSYAEDEQL